MSDIILDDDLVDEAAKAGWNHDWPDKPWESIPDELADYYRSSAVATMEAAAPLIAAKVLADADEHLARAAFAVDFKHHIHGTTCLCGFEGNARKRTQTEHITAAVIEEYNRDQELTKGRF